MAGKWGQLLAEPPANWADLIDDQPHHPQQELTAIIKSGGLPEPSVFLKTKQDQANYFSDYCQSYIEKDLHDLSNITKTADIGRLLELMAAAHVGQIVNYNTLSKHLGLPKTTISNYIDLLKLSYWLVELRAHGANLGRRLIKSPKIYWNDTGLAFHLGGKPQTAEVLGNYLENLVLGSLMTWSEKYSRLVEAKTDIYYWRPNGREIDFIIDSGDRLLPIEVKSTANPKLQDAQHLVAFGRENVTMTNKIMSAGLLLHCGHETKWLSQTVLAAPWWKLC